MLGYVIKRLVYMIPTLIGMSIIAFLIIQLPPGDYVTSLIASMSDNGQNADPAQIEAMRRAYGFDDPVWLQYLNYLKGIASFDLGPSFKYAGMSVNEVYALCAIDPWFLVQIEDLVRLEREVEQQGMARYLGFGPGDWRDRQGDANR